MKLPRYTTRFVVATVVLVLLGAAAWWWVTWPDREFRRLVNAIEDRNEQLVRDIVAPEELVGNWRERLEQFPPTEVFGKEQQTLRQVVMREQVFVIKVQFDKPEPHYRAVRVRITKNGLTSSAELP